MTAVVQAVFSKMPAPRSQGSLSSEHLSAGIHLGLPVLRPTGLEGKQYERGTHATCCSIQS